MSKIDTSKLKLHTGSGYPGKLQSSMEGRSSYRLGEAGGLTQFGANLVILEPGAKSSLRHWHVKQDEFLIVTEGELVLVMDGGETPLVAGDSAAFKAGVPNGHCVINKSDSPGKFLVVGTHTPEETAHYSDLDMKVEVKNGVFDFTKKDGGPLDPDMGEKT